MHKFPSKCSYAVKMSLNKTKKQSSLKWSKISSLSQGGKYPEPFWEQQSDDLYGCDYTCVPFFSINKSRKANFVTFF